MIPITVGLYLDTTSTEVSDSTKTSLIRMGKELLPKPQSLSERNLLLEGNQQNMVGISSKNLGGDFSNCDVKMELSPSIVEDYPGKKSSLHSWKRILRQSNNPSSTKAHESPSHSLKHSQSNCSQQGSPVLKKLAVECDNQASQHLFIGDALSSPSPTREF
nr:hypothetical protein CFP56_55212 [Quercus suber]